MAAQALIANEVGRSVPGGARRVADRVLLWGFSLGVAQAALFLLAKPLLVGLFTADQAVMAALDSVYIFIVVMQPLNALVFVLDGVFMGAEQFGFLARAMLLSAVVAAAVLLLVVPMGWGLLGVWWAMTTLMLVRGTTLVLRYRAGSGALTRG